MPQCFRSLRALSPTSACSPRPDGIQGQSPLSVPRNAPRQPATCQSAKRQRSPGQFLRTAIGLGFAVAAGLAPGLAAAQSSPPSARTTDGPRTQSPWAVDHWRTSPFHRAQNANGAIIPCRCVFQGHSYRVGDIVCMSTHVGVVLTRCDMNQNITSWVPSDQPCNVSQLPQPKTIPVQLAGR
jgi:hypothetical protein